MDSMARIVRKDIKEISGIMTELEMLSNMFMVEFTLSISCARENLPVFIYVYLLQSERNVPFYGTFFLQTPLKLYILIEKFGAKALEYAFACQKSLFVILFKLKKKHE